MEAHPPTLTIYAWAVFGSLVVELLALVRELGQNESVLPRRYRRFSYPIFRLAFAVIGAGPLAVLLSATTPIMAVYIGVSAPLIFDRTAAGYNLPPSQSGSG